MIWVLHIYLIRKQQYESEVLEQNKHSVFDISKPKLKTHKFKSSMNVWLKTAPRQKNLVNYVNISAIEHSGNRTVVIVDILSMVGIVLR